MEEAARQDTECNVVHPIVTVRDLKASIDFYVDCLGCRLGTGSTTTHTTATVLREGITREPRGRDVVMTEPFYCSWGDHRLYGVVHPPTGHPQGDAAVVLVNPVGQEHIRAYRTFAVMARRRAGAGCDAFRVDLAGVGNSSGELPDASLTEWTRNIGVAIEQIRCVCRARWICVAGVRLSASVALLAAAERPQIASYLLWGTSITGRRGTSGLANRIAIERIGGCNREWQV